MVRTSNHAILFDSGPDYHGLSDAGRSIVVPYLRGEGIGYLDLLVVSHDDLDHSGGAGSVVAAVGVGEIVSSVTANLDTSDKAKGDTDTAGGKRVDTGTRGWNPVSRCRAGQQWNFNGVQFEMLHPEDESYARANVV
ncbi:MAG: MBL fold metallo-hydrolase, partial [Burkholderiales bacterium]|nr:MBL fold metallo-hydrolase [Burkholderiales bacterium]